jgi:tRNA modification GTPase
MASITNRQSSNPNSQGTICAVATAPGGALGIIRISGPQALEIVSCCFTRNLSAAQPGTLHYGHIREGGEVVDEVVVSVFRAPRSYTGEDCVEISCHGSHYILNKVVELLIRHGARLANPGEFTQRAFLNGKMDLSQAEAVADLIASKTKATHDLAIRQLRGGISSELTTLRDQLLRLTSLLELELDFADHEELEFADRTELLTLARTIDRRVSQLADSFQTGNALKNGIPVAIVGAPNVGKSTLLNALVGEERAIVSDIQGTTRDAIEDTIQLGGITFRFIDTAGIRHTDDCIEQLGIERTFAAIERASVVLWLIDKEPAADEITGMRGRCTGKTLLIVQNKIDKGNGYSGIADLTLSAKYGKGLDELRERLISAVPKASDSDVIITNARHFEALCRAHDALTRVLDGLTSSLPSDLIAEDLRLTLASLAEITGGAITPQETLNNIFSHFCVGK